MVTQEKELSLEENLYGVCKANTYDPKVSFARNPLYQTAFYYHQNQTKTYPFFNLKEKAFSISQITGFDPLQVCIYTLVIGSIFATMGYEAYQGYRRFQMNACISDPKKDLDTISEEKKENERIQLKEKADNVLIINISYDFYHDKFPTTPSFKKEDKNGSSWTIKANDVPLIFESFLGNHPDIKNELLSEVNQTISRYKKIASEMGVSEFTLLAGISGYENCYVSEVNNSMVLPITFYAPNFFKKHIRIKADMSTELIKQMGWNDAVCRMEDAFYNREISSLSQAELDGIVAHETAHHIHYRGFWRRKVYYPVLAIGVLSTLYTVHKIADFAINSLVNQIFPTVENPLSPFIWSIVTTSGWLAFWPIKWNITCKIRELFKMRYQHWQEQQADEVAFKEGYVPHCVKLFKTMRRNYAAYAMDQVEVYTTKEERKNKEAEFQENTRKNIFEYKNIQQNLSRFSWIAALQKVCHAWTHDHPTINDRITAAKNFL